MTRYLLRQASYAAAAVGMGLAFAFAVWVATFLPYLVGVPR